MARKVIFIEKQVIPKICMLSIHALGDNRICKYSDSFISCGYKVINFHFGGYEIKIKGQEIQFPISNNRIIKRLYLYSGFKIIKYLKGLFCKNEFIIFHIHDPIVLNLSSILKRHFPISYIIYDRHEYFEDYRTFKYIKEARFYEIINKKNIDLLVTTCNEMKKKTSFLFKDVKCITINNYPKKDSNLNRENFIKAKNNILTLSYVGSLNWKGDRDIPLILRLVDAIESVGIDYRFYIAGICYDNELLAQFKLREKITNNRFSFLGQIPRDETIKITLRSHIGLNFLYPSRSHKQFHPPNKVYEYIYYGAIPFIRINIADIHIEEFTDYSYDENTTEEVIINNLKELVIDRNKIEKKIKLLLKKEYDLYWENEFNNLNTILLSYCN